MRRKWGPNVKVEYAHSGKYNCNTNISCCYGGWLCRAKTGGVSHERDCSTRWCLAKPAAVDIYLLWNQLLKWNLPVNLSECDILSTSQWGYFMYISLSVIFYVYLIDWYFIHVSVTVIFYICLSDCDILCISQWLIFYLSDCDILCISVAVIFYISSDCDIFM